jgi:hypothetical protein
MPRVQYVQETPGTTVPAQSSERNRQLLGGNLDAGHNNARLSIREEYVAHVPRRLGDQEQEDDNRRRQQQRQQADVDNPDVQATHNADTLSDRKVRMAAPWKAPTVSHGARSQRD